MKILEVIFTLSPGGAERFTVDISNELSRTNDVTLVAIKDDRVDAEHRLFYRFDLSDRVKYLNLHQPDGFSLKGQFKILKALKELNPDVIHINSSNILKFGFIAMFYLCKKTKIYVTIHSDLHNGYDNGVFKFFADKLGKKGLIKYAALSETNYKDLKDFYPGCEFRCIVNGRAPMIPTEKFDEVKQEIESYRITPDTKIFLHVARCHSEKNQHLLIDSFNELATHGVDAQLLILGAGFDSEEGKAILGKACKNINYLGTRKNISDYMLNADVFCLSSVFEGMPITLLEASLAGTPCVSTPVCGSVDLIVDGKNGYLSSGFSKEEYVEALRKTLDNYDVVKAGAMSMKDNSPYTIKECARKYLDYFKE